MEQNGGSEKTGTDAKPKFREKIRAIHDYIQASYYISDNNLKLGGEDWNDTILLSILTALSPGKEIMLGDVGNGKTTVSEAVTSIIYGYTPEFVEACELNGQPFLTEEKTFGRPDLGELQKSREKVVWSNFSKFRGAKIVDAINRLPEGTQNALLNSIDRGTFKYLNEVLYQDDAPFYATANYPDAGNTPLIRPLSDRFNVSVEVAPPIGHGMSLDASQKNKKLLKDGETTKRMLECMEKNDLDGLEKLRAEHKNAMAGRGIPTFSDEEIRSYRELVDCAKIEPEGSLIMEVFFSDANSIADIPGEHNGGGDSANGRYERSVTGRLESDVSFRWLRSMSKYAKSAAVALDIESVTPEAIFELMPYTLAHRAKFREKYAQENPKDEFYAGSQQKWLTKQLVRDFAKDFAEKKNVYQEFYRALVSEDRESMKKLAEKYDLPAIRSISYRTGVWDGKGQQGKQQPQGGRK